MFYILFIYGYFMVILWIIYGYSMDKLWIIYGLYMDNLWIIYGSGFWLSHPSEKYEWIMMTIPNIWENKKCSKPPTRDGLGRNTICCFFFREKPWKNQWFFRGKTEVFWGKTWKQIDGWRKNMENTEVVLGWMGLQWLSLTQIRCRDTQVSSIKSQRGRDDRGREEPGLLGKARPSTEAGSVPSELFGWSSNQGHN